MELIKYSLIRDFQEKDFTFTLDVNAQETLYLTSKTSSNGARVLEVKLNARVIAVISLKGLRLRYLQSIISAFLYG